MGPLDVGDGVWDLSLLGSIARRHKAGRHLTKLERIWLYNCIITMGDAASKIEQSLHVVYSSCREVGKVTTLHVRTSKSTQWAQAPMRAHIYHLSDLPFSWLLTIPILPYGQTENSRVIVRIRRCD